VSASIGYLPGGITTGWVYGHPSAHVCVSDAQADVSEALDKFADGQLSADDFIAAMQDMGVEVCDSTAISSYSTFCEQAHSW